VISDFHIERAIKDFIKIIFSKLLADKPKKKEKINEFLAFCGVLIFLTVLQYYLHILII
jgi:hypothetical protein